MIQTFKKMVSIFMTKIDKMLGVKRDLELPSVQGNQEVQDHQVVRVVQQVQFCQGYLENLEDPLDLHQEIN